jgi:hypothetical protein
MDKEKYMSSLARLALIAAGGTAAVVTFTGGVASAEAATAHPAAHASAGTASAGTASAGTASAGTASAGTTESAGTTGASAATRYVTRLVSSAEKPSVPSVYSQQYTQELPFTLIFDQAPPFGQV